MRSSTASKRSPKKTDMSEIALNQALRDWGVTKDELAQGVGISRPSASLICNRNRWPRKRDPEALREDITRWLKERLSQDDIYPPEAELKGLWKEAAASLQSEDQPGAEAHDSFKRKEMLPRKASLTNEAKKHFRLIRPPFGDVETEADMFLSGNVRYSREFVLEKIRNGGFGAIVGESGSGKTTLMEEVEEYLSDSQAAATLIRPMICGMDTGKDKGSPLKARSILLTILDAVAPDAKRPADLPRLTETVRRVLAERREGDRRFCLVIDDAHRLSGPTLNHLKDVYELKLGRTRLLGIVLLGQLRLGSRLDPHNPEVHQITQRCEVHYLPPLGADLEGYLERRYAAVGVAVDKVLAPDAYAAIRAKLAGRTTDGSTRKQVSIDLTYPLAVNNLLTAAMNSAADPRLPSPLVTAEIIREV
jgi:type II secretory pathway predicted ATPase ExeA